MALEVLSQRSQIDAARRTLIKRRISLTETPMQAQLRRWGLRNSLPIGDPLKSWDVLKSVQFLEQHLSPSDPILDIGCFASELIVILHKLGYSQLAGADLNPLLGRMPFADAIRYAQTDFMHTPFEDRSFQAITAISVIEHGFACEPLLAEVTRLLRPGGYFLASFDYWPDKIDTAGKEIFGMSWTIFSQEEVADFVAQAARHGLVPCGELAFGGQERVIHYEDRQYTFAWLALKKIE